MHITPDNQWIDDIRQRIQAALNESKRNVLREQYGMRDEYRSPDMSPEMETEFLDYVLEFERQFENAPRITVRARIGDPTLPPLDTINAEDLVAATDALIELLAAYYIAVDFLGDVDYEAVYRYLTEELLDEEIDDIRIPEMWLNFTYATDEYNAEWWVSEFVNAVFRRGVDDARTYVDDGQLWANSSGKRTTNADLEALWTRLPVVGGLSFEPVETQIEGDEGQLIGRVTWTVGGEAHSLEASFQVYRSRYLDEAWSIGQTTLIDQLWGIYG